MIRRAAWTDSLHLTSLWEKMKKETISNRALMKECDPESYFRHLVARMLNEDWYIYIAEEKNEIVGFLTAFLHWPNYGRAHIIGTVEDIYVLPEHRGDDLYKELIAVAVAAGRERGMKEMEFQSTNDAKMIRLYRQIGFEPVFVTYRQKEAS